MVRIKNTKNIIEGVLEELQFTDEEEKLFKDLVQTVKKSKNSGDINTGTEIVEKIEGVFKDDI